MLVTIIYTYIIILLIRYLYYNIIYTLYVYAAGNRSFTEFYGERQLKLNFFFFFLSKIIKVRI